MQAGRTTEEGIPNVLQKCPHKPLNIVFQEGLGERKEK